VLIGGSVFELSLISFSWPSSSQWGLLAALGTIGCAAHLLVVYAFSLASASSLAPLQYFEILGATLFGWYFFSDIPSITTWLGIAIIVGSGIYVMAREQTVKQQ
ncbi:MAG: EamA family transporter, partial [Pseudomonadota bacterium]